MYPFSPLPQNSEGERHSSHTLQDLRGRGPRETVPSDSKAPFLQVLWEDNFLLSDNSQVRCQELERLGEPHPSWVSSLGAPAPFQGTEPTSSIMSVFS